MEANEFWTLIDRSRSQAGAEHDPTAQADALTTLLTGRSSEDLQAFDRHYREQLAATYRWDIWGVGYILAGGMCSASFESYRDWIISRGCAVLTAALADAESLVDVPGADREPEAEPLRHAATRAHRATHGSCLPPTLPPHNHTTTPAGEPWDEDDITTSFPRAAAKVGW
jgi:hypothetical protein